MSITAAAAYLGRDVAQVSRWVQIYQIPKRRTVNPDGYHALYIDVDALVAAREDRRGSHPGYIRLKEVARQLGITRGALRHRARKAGVAFHSIPGWEPDKFIREADLDRLRSKYFERANSRRRDADGRKQCSRCDQWKPEAEFYAHHDRNKDGLYGHCMVCHHAITKAWRKNNLESVREKMREWRENNREYIRDVTKGLVPPRRPRQ